MTNESGDPFAPANTPGSSAVGVGLAAIPTVRKRDQRPDFVIVVGRPGLIDGVLIDGRLIDGGLIDGLGFFPGFLRSIGTVTAIRFGTSHPVLPAPNNNFECHVAPLKKTGAAILLKKTSRQYSFPMADYGTR
jgi:hypothetical protein